MGQHTVTNELGAGSQHTGSLGAVCVASLKNNTVQPVWEAHTVEPSWHADQISVISISYCNPSQPS